MSFVLNKYILDWTQFSFENHGVSGNLKYQVIPDFPYVSVTLCTEVLGQQSEKNYNDHGKNDVVSIILR